MVTLLIGLGPLLDWIFSYNRIKFGDKPVKQNIVATV